MAKVHLVQYLCPNRHCLVAATYLEGDETFEAACAEIRASLDSQGLKPECVCGSTAISFEDIVTRFESLAEARAHLLELQEASFLEVLRLRLTALREAARN